MPIGKRSEKSFNPVEIDLPIWRKLEQDGTKFIAESRDDSDGDAKPEAVSKSVTVTKENDMSSSTKLIANLAVAIGLIGSLAVSAATPSLARTHSAAPVHTMNPVHHRGGAPVDDPRSDFAGAYTVNPVHHRGGAPVDDPPGSAFQDWGNDESMGCPC